MPPMSTIAALSHRLYLLVDPTLCTDPAATAAAAVAGGAGIIQLRAKGLTSAAYHALAAEVMAATRSAGGCFIVNDHVTVAAELGADGCHLGQDDCAPAEARAQLGDHCLIGLSCHSREQVCAAQQQPIDYVGLGPMYATSTKPHEPVQGPGLLDAVRDQLRWPSYAIGGLTIDRVAALGARIPHGVAVSSAICQAANPTAEAQRWLAALA